MYRTVSKALSKPVYRTSRPSRVETATFSAKHIATAPPDPDDDLDTREIEDILLALITARAAHTEDHLRRVNESS